MEQVTPLFESWKEAGQRPELDLESVENLLYGRTGQELVEMVQPCLGTVSQDLADVFAYMLDKELLDAEVLDSKSPEAYTIDLPAYQPALVYLSPDNLDLFTLVHEFGHFADTCLAPNLASWHRQRGDCFPGAGDAVSLLCSGTGGAGTAAALRWMEVYNLLGAIMDAARLGPLS